MVLFNTVYSPISLLAVFIAAFVGNMYAPANQPEIYRSSSEGQTFHRVQP